MPAPSLLVVGLGNPGPDYATTRHNIGFMALDAIAAHHKASAWKKKFQGLAAATVDPPALLLKPQTFMNLSGEAVGEAARFHKLAPDHVIVFHDDLDLQPGQVKVKQGGGNAGHNGLKSLDAHIGPDYWRVRLGIGRPEARGDAVTHYVLAPFARADRAWLEPLLDALSEEFGLLCRGKKQDYAAHIARRLNF